MSRQSSSDHKVTPSFALICFTALIAVTGCDKTTREKEERVDLRWSDTPGAPATGPSFEDEDFRFHVESPRTCGKAGPMAPASGQKRLSVPVEILAKTAREIPVNALLFTLEDSDGHEFRPTLAGCAPTMPQTKISGGRTAKGEVAFDVPLDPGALELRYEPFLIGREKVVARVKIKPL